MNDIFGGSDETERTQPLAPRTPQAEPVQEPTEAPTETPTAEPADVPEDAGTNRMLVQRGFDPQPMMRLADVDPRAIIKPPERLQPITSIRRSMKDKSLEAIGINWKDHKDEPQSKPLFDNDVGFYELDYDPLNEKGRERGTVGVQAANIFGRQFTREELEKDSEGRKIIQMMEGVRSGEFREQGFLKGLTDFDRSNIPFVGVAMDIGTGVSDAIDMSETMRKMQRGEAVTDHEALAVRRFMLQQEIESGRTFGYGVGAVIRQAPTFMAEMALAGKVVTASTAVGSATGGVIGGAVGLFGTGPVVGDEPAFAAAGAAMGAKVGAVVGTVIAGPLVWGKRAIERLGSKAAGKAAKEAALREVGKYATRGAAEGFTTAEGLAIRRAAGKEFFTKEARQAVMAEMREKMGAEASEAAVRKAAQFETYRRAAAQAAKVTMDGKALDVGIATRIAVGGDEANLLQGEYRRVIEQMSLRAAGVSDEEFRKLGYFGARRKIKEGFAKLMASDRDFMTKVADDFVDGTTKSFDDAAYRELYANLMNTSRDAMGGAGRDLVAGSMSDVTGQIIAGENSFARQVTKALIGNQMKSLQLKYGGRGFVNGMERAARYVGEHVANGVLRWDVSAFGGSIGTIARSGAVHGGKMAALKDAIGIAMIEAPVRGAMQIGAQAPLWPVYAVAAGRAPWDFTIRGQLGNQATALRTGDEELMDNARAVAFGSLLVEYASENAGRGFNAAAGGIVAPVWQKTFLAKPTARLGSYMNQKLNAMFGLDKMMQPGHNERLVRFLDRHLKTQLANMGEGSLADGIIAQDLKKIVQTRSFDGISDATRQALNKLGYKKANKMIRDAAVSQKWRTATQFMVADFMLRKGITPQRFNAMLERVGYDGVISEMTEERYGGFLKGLFGLNDNPSDETWADRWRAAMEGLFPDKRQLLTEAIAFSVPSVASMSLQTIHRAIGAGSGGMQELQEDVATLRSAQSARGTVSIPGVTAEYAQRLREWKAHLDGVTDQTLGKSADNAAKARAGVAESLAGDRAFVGSLNDAGRGRIAPILDARTDAERDQFVDSLVADLVRARDYASLKAAMDSFNAEALFGQEGVTAIENEWRKQQGHSFDATDAREQALSGPSGMFAQMLKDAPLYEGDADISDIVGDITVQLGGTRSDEGILGGAARRGGEGHESGLNMFSEDLLDQVASSMQRIGKKMHQSEKGVGNDLSLGRRLAMHVVGIIDGLFTGNLALASANPVQYMYEDANLPRSLMGKLRKEYKSSLLVAERQLRESGERITEAKMEQIADEIMAKRARDYAAAFLASSNVLAVSRSDISEAALRLVGYRSRNADGTFGTNKHASFRDEEFRAEHSQDIEAARREVLQALAETAASGIIAMNDHSGMGHRTSMALNLTRAMQYGTTPEIMAAIGELPVFRHLHKVFDISGMEQEYNDVVNSGFFGRQVETDIISSIDASRDAVLSPEQLADVAAMMGRDMTLYTEQENQEAVKQFVRQVQAVVESGLNARYEDRTGANRAVSVVKDATGFSVTYEETAGGRIVAERKDNMDEVRELLDEAGFTTVDKRIVMTTNRSITFSDALSGVLFLNQDNLENARAELLRYMGLSEDTVNEELLPHMLRRDPANGNRMGYTDAQTGRFVDVSTDAGRREAADAVKRLIEAADRADRTNDNGDLRAKAIVYGGVLDGSTIPGFSRAADKLVRSRGAVDSYEDQAASALGQTRGYTFRVGALTAGDTLIISRDYDNGADSEALLRAAISNGLRSGFARTPEADRPVRNAILSKMAREFRAAANRVIDGLDPKADADRIDAIRAAVESVLSEEGSAVTFDGIAAMTAAMAFFTSERGLSDVGNGFLYQPELAKIADEARKAEVFPFFLSEMDQLLGGNGFFTEEAASLAGLARLRDAFAPSGKQIIDSRRSSMFDGGSAGATGRIASTNPGVSTLRWTEQGLASGIVEHAVEDTTFKSVESYLSQVAASCHDVAGGFKRVFGAVPASTEDAYRRLHANELGGTTSRRASIVGEVLGSDEAAAPADTGVSGAVSRAARNAAATTRRPSGREIPLKTAISLARNFLFLVPDGASAASIRTVRQRLDSFLEGRGVSDADRARIGNAFSITAERKARYGARAEAARAEASDVEKELDQKAEGGNAEIFLDNERRDALVENEDLMDCGDQLYYVFPVESTNYTAVLHRVRTELMRLRGIEDLELGDNFSTLADALNVFNAPREGRATDRLASVEAFDNDEVTTMLLDEAIGKLVDAGRLDLAFALSALRNIPQTEGRRGKALRLVGQMSPVDGFYAEQGDDGLFAGKRQGSRAAKASITSVRSVYMSAFNNALGGRSSADLGARLSALVNLLKGDEAHFDATKGWFGGLDVKSLTQVLGAAAKPMTDVELDPFRACWTAKPDQIPAIHDRLAEAVTKIQERLLGTADAIERLFGANELCYALRNPAFVQNTVNAIEDAVRKGDKEAIKSRVTRLQLFQPGTVSGTQSPSLFLNHTFVWAFMHAKAVSTGTAGVRDLTAKLGTKDAAAAFANTLSGETARLATRSVFKNVMKDFKATGPFGEGVEGGARAGSSSPLAQLLSDYASSMPRSTDTLQGRGSSGFRDVERTTLTPASPLPAALAVEDKILAKLPAGAVAAYREVPVDVSTKGKGFVNHSGGALGSDSAWGDIGEKYGVKSNHYYKGKTPKGNVQITEDQYKEGLQKVEAAVGPLGRKIPYSKPYVVGLLSRNWQQVRNSDAVFAIAQDFDSKGNVLGGTGWAVQMAKAEGKPIHVFSQKTGVWYSWNGSAWVQEGTPKLTKNFAGIGTRELGDTGRKAIEAVYRNTFGADTERVAETPKAADERTDVNSAKTPKFSGHWTREQVAGDSDRIYLFGDNTDDRTRTGYVPTRTQAVIRGLPNAIGIDTKKDRGTSPESYFTDADFDAFKQQVDEAIAKAKATGKEIVVPADGIGTGKAQLATRAPKLFKYLDEALSGLLGGARSTVETKSVLEDYLQRGGRFRDGSTLTAVSLGAKTRYGDLAEASFVSRMVNDANMGDYVKRNDSTRFRFQLYHGEKPTAYSLQLPGEVANELFKRVMAERDADEKELFPSHVPQGIDLDALAEVEDIRTVDDEATREQVYRLLYASVAAAARCDQISPKRTQVLSSQGTMIASYRDSRLLVREDSEGVKSLVRVDFSGEQATPGHYISVILGGGDATAWMGLWLDHGVLIESMRAMSTNPDAVSFKSHGFSLFNAMFQKGQGHDLGLGMNVIERKPDGGYRLGRSRYDLTANESLLDGQRRMRARLAHLLGYRGSRAQLLEPVDEETFNHLSPEEQKDRYDAMMAADRFFQHSSMRVTDTETNKAGPLSGDCGFWSADGIIEMSSEKLGTFYFSPETMEYSDSVEAVDGVRKLKGARKIPAFDCAPEVKNGAVTIAWGLAAFMKVATKDTVDAVTGEKHVRRLSSSDCGEITSSFRRPTGEVIENVPLKDAGIFLDYGSATGDRVEVDDDGDTATFQFFTRNDISQIVANSDAESDCSTEHPYATNASRDTYLNEVRTKGGVAINEIPDTVAALCVNRAVNFSALLVNSPTLVDARVAADEELFENLLRNPFDLQERGREFRKKNSVYARSARVPVYSNHGVLLPSGGKVTSADIFAHTCEIEWAPGTTQYTKDMFRPARVYTTEEAAAFGQARSYSSGAVNIRDDGSFRYGMALDPAKWDSFVNRFGKVFGIQAHDDLLFQLDGGAEVVMGTDSRTCDELAKVFSYFRSASTRGTNVLVDTEVAGRRGGEVQNVQLATDVFSQFLGCFTDYTGLHLNDGAHRDVSRMSFDDLFREDGSFDLAAIDRRTAKVDGGTTAERLFIGGSFFSGSRRPSGNIEAAAGMCRATMPVTFSRNGTPGATALYQLDPVVNYVQGSDTDGDSASIIIHKGRYDDNAVAAVRGLAKLAAAIFNEDGSAMRGEFDEYRSRARRFYDEAKRRHPKFFREDGSASEAFHDAIANLVFRTEVENYRRSKAVHQGWAENPASNAPAYDMSLIADSSKDSVPDVGAVGRRPVSPDLLNGTRKVGSVIAKKYAKHGVKPGMDFKKAFKAYVNSVNPEINSDLLDPVSAASLSDAAADASDGRGVMVALQASIEHLGALAANDREMQKVAPALLEKRADGYDPLADFIGHLDGVSNALFDVVKDMFAPRAGWRKEMLTYMIGRFVVHANDAYAKDKSVQFDDAWFFREAVSFIDDARKLDTFAGRLMYATGDITGVSAELQDRYDAFDGETLLARLLASANARPERFNPAKRTFLSHIGIMMRTAIDSGRLEDLAKKLKPKVRGMLTEIIANERNALMGTQYTLLAADVLFSTEEELAKRGNPVEKAYEAYRAYDVMNTIRVLENAASPDSSFSGDPSRVGTYQRASELDRISDRSKPYSLRNAAKGLINGVTGANMRRMLDESVDARTEAREMTTDIDDFDAAVSAHSSFEDAFNAFAEGRDIPTESLRRADIAVFEKALTLAKRSNAKYAVNAGTVANNRDMLHHVIGAVASMENGKYEEALKAIRASLAKGGTEGFRRDVASVFADLVEASLNSVGPSTALRTFYEYLNVDRASGDITFLAKPDSEDAIDVANGLVELHNLEGSVNLAGVEVPLSQLPRVFMLHQAVSGSFSGTSDPRVRPNPAAFFGTDALNNIERWGTGITKHPASRLLCLVRNEAKGSSAYNIAAALPVIEELVKAPGYAAACSARPALSSTALQAIDIAEDSVLRTNNGFRAEGVRFQLTDPIAYHVGDRKGRARKLVNRRSFDTLEEAYNDLVDQVLAAHFGTDGLITGGEVIRTAVDGIKPQGIIRYTGLDELETMKKILVSSMRGETGEALKEAVLALDDRSLDFSSAVKRTPGVTRTNAPALLAMKEYLLSQQATQAGGETRRASIQGAPEIGEGSYAIAQRMRRGDFSIAGKNRGPQAAVTHALESAFGKWKKDSGVRVTRIKRDGKPVNLLKVERRLKTKKGVKTVVTYISYGDAVVMDLTDANQVDSLVNYLHQRGWKGTAKDFMSLSVEERNYLAIAFGARVRGESVTGIDTNGVLALSGLIRLSDTATFNTLFHEYFHQMYDLMDKTGALSQDEKDALAGEYRMADGRFDEEAAADAFARYVTDMNESGSTRMFSSGKEAVESAFSNIRKTCKAFAEALSAEDATGAPAFMKALITGDLTDRLTKRLDDAANLQLKEIEDALLGEETLFESVKTTYLSGDQLALASEVRAAVERNAPMKDVKAAIRALIDGKAPQFEAHLNEPSVMEQGELDFSERPVEARRPAHPETPVGRMQEFMKAALDRFGVDSAPLGLDGEQELRRLRDLSQWGELPASEVMLLASTARRVIADTADFLGYKLFDVDADGKSTLTAEGREFLSDDAVTEMTMRLCRHMNAKVAAENRENPYGKRAVNASADKVYGAMLAEVAKERWVPYTKGRIDEAADGMLDAAAKLRQRADAVDGTDHERAVAMRNDATRLEVMSRQVRHAFTQMMNGARLHEVQGFPDTYQDDFTYGNLLGGVRHELLQDGRKRYLGGNFSADATAMQEFQVAMDKAAHTLFTVACARSYIRKIGQDFPPLGAEPEVRKDDPAPDPGYLIDEADTSAQMILQSPGAWMAADMMRDFMGVSMRDVMTDHDIKAKTESANLLASTMDFVFGADCHAGEKVREISFGTSDVGFDESGIDVHDERMRHSFMKFAAVRSVDPLGIIIRDAKRAGRELSLEDCDTIDFIGQVVKAMSCGDRCVVTGIDLPWPNKATLDVILNNWKNPAVLLDGPLSRASVTARVKRYTGETATSQVPFAEGAMPNNIDHMFYRVYEALPEDFQQPVLEALARAIIDTAEEQGTNTGTAASGDARERLARRLSDLGLCETSKDGRCVLVIPTEMAKDAWHGSEAYAKLKEAGRTAGMLNLEYWAARFASEANALHEVAAKSQFMQSATGRKLTSAASCGMWFHHGSGAHRLNVARLENAKELFGEKASPDEKLAVYHAELMEILQRHSQAEGVSGMGAGNEKAFSVIRDASGNLRVSGGVTHRQVQYLIRLLSRYGVLVRDSRGNLAALQKNFNPVDFVLAVQRGEFSFGGGRGLPVHLDADSTVFDFDKAIYTLVTQAVADEIAGIGSGVDEFGTKQGLIDAHELASRLERDLGAQNKGRVAAVSPVEMFRMSSRLGSSMSAAQNLRSMCEEIVAAERYKGAMTQMLQTVGPDGAMNYIVKPTDAASRFLPDEYWGALARFTIARNQGVPGVASYDMAKTGVENMKAVYDSLDTKEAADHLAGTDVRDGRPNAIPVKYAHFENLRGYAADTLFEHVLVRRSGPSDDPSVLDKAVGGEAMGYMKQLLGMVAVPPSSKFMANGVDRLMSYSKVMSVGISAFFAFATRFESPVASSGFWATAMGYHKKTADAARKIGASAGRAGQTGAFNSDAVFLADILHAITSNDPYVREMRELCDLIGMPLTDSIQNPITDRQGAIDKDIDTMCRFIERTQGASGIKYSKRLRAGLRAALHNPTEYTFSNVLNGVKMAVVSQALRSLREECREQARPFDPVRELRKYSPYINAEIGGIDPGRYAFLTPQMQRVLRRSMFSYQWTLGAWVAGTGEVVSDLLGGGHNTTPELRRFAFIRWLRMLGIVKVGVPVFMQMAIKSLSTCIAAGMGDPDGDDDDPYGIEAMPWLCFNNEEKIGALSFDITPLLRLCGSSETMRDIKLKRGAWPYISAVAGGAIGYGFTKGPVGAAIGAAIGLTAGDLVPAYVGRGRNTTGNRRYYMHFGKQSDEFWRWFTGPWQQATSKLSIPTQKVIEAMFGSVSGSSSFAKSFAKKDLADRFFTTNLDPNENAVTNLFTAFLPFSSASVASHPDSGFIGILGPVQLGASKTYIQKRLVDRLVKFAEDDRHRNPWATKSNRASLELLCKDILDDAALNGVDPKDILTSALGQAASREYTKLFNALPKDIEDNAFDVKALTSALRALARLNRKNQAILQALGKRYKAAGIDWEAQPNAKMGELVRRLVEEQAEDPYGWGHPEYDELVSRFADGDRRDVSSVDVQQDRKGGEAFSNFLATDDVPETLFGIPVVSQDYTEEDLEFFKRNPKAAGFYDLGDDNEDPNPPPDDDGPTANDKGGKSKEFMKRNPSLFSHVKSFEKMSKEPYEDVGGYAIGYGAHLDKDGEPVTKDTAAIDEATATSMLARDLYTRREKLAKMLPNWTSIPGNARQALLDVSMGKDDILSASESEGLHGDLTAAGKDAAKLLAAVKKHYYSYLTQDPKLRKGLMARRIAGGKLFFGEDFSYDGKAWDSKLGFVKKGRK